MTRNFLQMFFKGALIISAASMILAGCAKDGNDGIGLVGPAGANGKDAIVTCKLCHNPSVVDSVATQFQLSKHEFGEAADGEAGNTACAPCHEQEGFKYVCNMNIPATFAKVGTDTTYTNLYMTTATTAYGKLGCFTCHSSLHTSYGYADFTPLTTVAPVPMTMWAGAKTINLTQDGGKSNLCVKCHQPRPFTKSNTGQDKNVLNYAQLVSLPNDTFYSPTRSNILNVLKPSYRTHTHYGTVGAIFAGKGGVEFGTQPYPQSIHSTAASCQNCHMAPMTGAAGGHSFKAKGNFNGCNNATCHKVGQSSGLMSASNADFVSDQSGIKALLTAIASKLKINGVEILNRNGDATTNLWYSLTANHYDGYLNIYDPVNNPTGSTYNTTMFKNPSTTGFTAAQITTNNSLPAISLTNAQMGAIINFQLCLREYSLGVHNYKYTNALLTNTLAILP
ncbi:MAG: hypothetical protein HXX18_00490 [Bacteroidetes bacterium]|nr:hypothetical protein [Bacteroidota bacterium]